MLGSEPAGCVEAYFPHPEGLLGVHLGFDQGSFGGDDLPPFLFQGLSPRPLFLCVSSQFLLLRRCEAWSLPVEGRHILLCLRVLRRRLG